MRDTDFATVVYDRLSTSIFDLCCLNELIDHIADRDDNISGVFRALALLCQRTRDDLENLRGDIVQTQRDKAA